MNVEPLLGLCVLICITLQIALVALGVYRELLNSHFQLYILGTFYIPALALLSLRQSIQTRNVAITFISLASLSSFAGAVVISVQWWIKGNEYLDLQKINNEVAALWCIVIGMIALTLTGIYAVVLLWESIAKENKSK